MEQNASSSQMLHVMAREWHDLWISPGCILTAALIFDLMSHSSDVNECLTGSHNCVTGQICINTEGSFRCQRETSCGTGYELKDDNTCQGNAAVEKSLWTWHNGTKSIL